MIKQAVGSEKKSAGGVRGGEVLERMRVRKRGRINTNVRREKRNRCFLCYCNTKLRDYFCSSEPAASASPLFHSV